MLVRPACRQAGRLIMYFVYIIRSKSTGKFYTGITNNIYRRLKEHNQKLSNTHTTKNLTDYDLMFCQIEPERVSARNLERYLKSGAGREVRNEIIQYGCLGL